MTPAYDSSVVAVGDAVEALNESVILLRRIAKLLEPMATQDTNQRQRIAISSVEVGMPVSSYGGVDSRFQIVDWARTAYNTGIRSNLIFS
jgi:SpoU rRNA methylase family enzyme